MKTSVAKSWKEVSEAARFPSEGPHVEGCGRKAATETETKEEATESKVSRRECETRGRKDGDRDGERAREKERRDEFSSKEKLP